MAPGSKAGEGRSGGKIMRQRRNASARKTPYQRPLTPPPPPPPPQESPNWLTGLILPATSKFLSSFWNPMTWSPSSSSSSDVDSEDGIEDDSEDYEQPSDEVIELNQKKGSSSGMLKSYGNDLQLTVKKSETLHLIEQLLMLEYFSREECDRLIEIINSRVVNCSAKEGMDAGLNEILSRRTDNESPAICSQAIMEAKKWVEEKKVGSSSKSELDHGICAFNSFMKQDIVEGETSSPVDMAKSYMQARPPWASPTMKHNHLVTSSPVVTELFKEGTPYSRDYLSAGSWNIQEELRRLRSKATEDMLNTHRSTKFASFAPERNTTACSLAADTTIEVIEPPELNSLTAPKSVDESVKVAAGVSTLSLSDLEITPADLPTEAVPSNPTLLVPEQNKDLDYVKMVEEQGAASESHETVNPEHMLDQYMVMEGAEFEGEAAANSSAASEIELSAGLEREQNNRHSDEGNGSGRRKISMRSDEGKCLEREQNSTYEERNPDLGRSSDDKLAVEGSCELLTETSVDVPNVNETIGIVNGSESISDLETGSLIENQPTKKHGRYSRKSRGRGKR